MTSFSEYQSSMADQMRERLGASKSSGNSELATAAQNLNMTATLQSRQSQQTASSIESQGMQIQQLTQSVQQLVLQMRMSTQQAFNDAPRPVDTLGPTGGRIYGGVHAMGSLGAQGAKFGAASMGGFAMGQAKGIYGAMRGTYRNTAYPFAPVPHGFGGEVAAGHMAGVIPTMMHGMGSYYNPATMQQGTFGAYQRGISHQLGQRAQSMTQGGFSALASVASASTLGGAIGDRLIPIPFAGGMIGSKLMEPLDALNPLAYASKEVGRANYFGQQAQTASYGFLRGRDAFQTGRFGMREEAQIGTQMRKLSLNDLTLSDKDIGGLQQGAAMSGQMLGVQNADDYVRRMKQQLDTAKVVMKIANVASSQANEILADARLTMGFSAGAKTQAFMGQVGALAPMAGLSYTQMFGAASTGAQQYAGSGMYANMGARMGVATKAMSGVAATGMSASSLANAGGEDGVARVIAETTQKYLQGIGGTLISAGGGGYGSFGGGISRAVGGLQSSGDMVGFMANKQKRLSEATDGMGTFGVQIQQARDLMQLTNEFQGVGGSKRDRAKLLAKNQYGLDDAGADALLSSMSSLGETVSQSQRLGNRQFQDVLRDQVQERNSFSGRSRLFYRRGMEKISGGMADGVVNAAATAGEFVGGATQETFDYYSGIKRRYVSQDTADQIADTDNLDDIDSGGQKGGYGRVSMMEMSKSLAHVKDINSPTAKAIEQLVKGANKQGGLKGATMMGAAAWALRTGKRYDTGQELVSDYMDSVTSDPSQKSTKTDIMNISGMTGVSQSTREGMAKKMGMTGAETGGMESKAELLKDLRGSLGELGMGNEELMGAAGSKTGQRIITGLQELYRMYDPIKEDKQGDAYDTKARELANQIRNINDPAVKTLVENLMRESGAKLTGNGTIDFGDSIKMLSKQSGLSGSLLSRGRNADRSMIEKALHDHSANKSIDEIAKTNPVGADYLRNNSDAREAGVGVLSSGAGYTKDLLERVGKRNDRESKVKAIALGLGTLGEKGSALNDTANIALGAVNTADGTVDREGIAARFAGMDDKDIMAMSESKDQTEVKLAEYAAALKTGQMTSKEAGNKMTALIMKRGNMSGSVVEGDTAEQALKEGMLGSESMKAMLSQQQQQVEMTRMMLEELKELRSR